MTEVLIIYVLLIVACIVGAFTDKKHKFLWCALAFTGLLGIILCLIASDVESENFKVIPLLVPVGLLCVVLGLNSIWSSLICTKKVIARCTGYQSRRFKGFLWFYPIFKYTYEGRTFVSRSFASCLESDYNALYNKNTDVTIYVNPKNPELCVDKRKLPVARSIVVMVFGGFALLVAVALLVI